MNKLFSIKKLGSLADPTRIFIAILIASLFIFAPIVNKETAQVKKDAIPDLKPFASSADACPWACIKCTAWGEAGPRPVLNTNVLMPAAIVANLTLVAVAAGLPIRLQLLRLPLRVAFQAEVDGV